jgi:SAM-dependent methyltransferase
MQSSRGDPAAVSFGVAHHMGTARRSSPHGPRAIVKLPDLTNLPVLRGGTRRAADWVDLQLSFVVQLLEQVAPQAHGRMLDVGCGKKPYESIFHPYVSDYIGIEHESCFAGTNASQSDRQPDLFYDGVRLPFEDGSFDTVLNVQVLEHTPHPGLLVAELGRVLRRDGILILSAPFQARLHEEPYDYFRYSPHGLRTLLGDAGLEIVQLYNQGSLWSVVAHKLNSYLALRVARIGSVAQAMGKLSHEAPARNRPRLWTLPLVAPTMVGLAGAARIMDRYFAEPEEALGFLVVARRAPSR